MFLVGYDLATLGKVFQGVLHRNVLNCPVHGSVPTEYTFVRAMVLAVRKHGCHNRSYTPIYSYRNPTIVEVHTNLCNILHA
jgi:hypothetical protein